MRRSLLVVAKENPPVLSGPLGQDHLKSRTGWGWRRSTRKLLLVVAMMLLVAVRGCVMWLTQAKHDVQR